MQRNDEIVVGGSCKRNDELKAAKVAEIEYLISIHELETGAGLNQIGTLQRAKDTHWSSHLRSVSSLIKMFNLSCEVLLNIIEDGSTLQDRGKADAAYESLTSFEFVSILHLIKEIMKIPDILYQALQFKSQDIVNAIRLVSSTKSILQTLRDEGYYTLLATLKEFCNSRTMDIPDITARYVPRRGRARHHSDEFVIEHYYLVDIFYGAIDSQLLELNSRFNEHSMKLISLSLTLDHREHASFDMKKVCKLVDKFYPHDFTEQEKIQLNIQLHHYWHNVVQALEYQNFASISALCEWRMKTRRSTTYHLFFRVIVLVLTLHVSIATAERSLSTMKIIKTRLRNKMEDKFLSNTSLIYFEREISSKIDLDCILDDFHNLRERKIPF